MYQFCFVCCLIMSASNEIFWRMKFVLFLSDSTPRACGFMQQDAWVCKKKKKTHKYASIKTKHFYEPNEERKKEKKSLKHRRWDDLEFNENKCVNCPRPFHSGEQFNVWIHPARDSITKCCTQLTRSAMYTVHVFDLKVEWSTLYFVSYGTKINLNWFWFALNEIKTHHVRSKVSKLNKNKNDQQEREKESDAKTNFTKFNAKIKPYLHMEHRHDRAVQKIPFAIVQFELVSA